MMMTGPIQNAPLPWNVVLIMLWVFSLFYTVTALPVQFVYRYFLICNGTALTKGKYALLLLSAFIAAFIYGIGTSITFWPEEEILNKTLPLLKNDSYYYEGIPNYVVANINGIKLKLLFTYCYFLVFGSYTILIFANYKVWKHLKLMEHQMSKQTKDIHRQITKTLFIQAIIPCIVCIIPVATAVTATFLHLSIPGVGPCISLILCWIPIANPSLTMIVVRGYRNAILRYIGKLLFPLNNRIKIVPSTTILKTIPDDEKHSNKSHLDDMF